MMLKALLLILLAAGMNNSCAHYVYVESPAPIIQHPEREPLPVISQAEINAIPEPVKLKLIEREGIFRRVINIYQYRVEKYNEWANSTR